MDSLYERIDTLVIKTIIAVEPLLWNGIEMFIPGKRPQSCFELLGFDVLIDE